MASRRAIRRRSCKGKQPHPDQTAAVKHLIALKKKDVIAQSMRTYKCPFGNHWHVGHQ